MWKIDDAPSTIWKDGHRYTLDPIQKTAQLPAEYTEDDPLDMDVTMALVEDLATDWYMEDHATQRQAIANAFRAALTSPRQNLKWNSIVYQDLMGLPPELDDPEEFEQTIRDRKAKWDRFGQQTIDLINEQADDPEWIDYGPRVVEKYMPGIWENIRRAGVVGPYIEDLRVAAIEDVKQGGDGRYFRESLMQMDIPGIGPKVAAFVWLLLCPKTSKLATIDVHMMRVLGQEAESPRDYRAYLQFEKQLDQMRVELGYTDVPLGAFQWALWDQQRTPGFHQDHTSLRPLNPVDWRHVDWAPQERTRKSTPPAEIPGQMSLEPEMPAQDTAPVNPERPLLDEGFITPPGQVGQPQQATETAPAFAEPSQPQPATPQPAWTGVPV